MIILMFVLYFVNQGYQTNTRAGIYIICSKGCSFTTNRLDDRTYVLEKDYMI